MKEIDPVQAMTLAMLVISLACLIPLARRSWAYDWSICLTAATGIMHMIVFYTFVVFFYDRVESFTYWSKMLRFHEGASLLIILLTLVIRPYIWRRCKVTHDHR